MTNELLAGVPEDLLAIAKAAGAITEFVERGGTPAMKATCSRIHEIDVRLGRWVDLQRAAPTPASVEMTDVLQRLGDLGDLLEDVRAVCEGFHAERRLERVAELAGVFASIDDALNNLERTLPAAS